MTKEPNRQKTWGIIRYAPGSGRFPDEDAAAFDGWYADRADALSVAEEWATKFPHWIVGLVCSDAVWFGNGNFSTGKGPLTYREYVISERDNEVAHP